MYNYNFEAINQVLNKRMKKLEIEYGPFICIIILYLILCIRFRKEFLMLSLLEKLLTFAHDAVCRYNYDSNYKRSNFFQLLKVVFNILYTTFCIDQPFYVTLIFVFSSSLRQVQIINETRLNYVNIKATRGYNCQ